MTERIGRFMLFYAALVVILVGVRFATRDSEQNLKDLQAETADLLIERSNLQFQLANLESPTRVRRWAFENNMIPFSSASSLQLVFKSLKPLKPLSDVKEKIVIDTKWR
jgi:cell division protein FtsL